MSTEKEFASTVKWYILYTSSRAEKQVSLRLSRRGVENWLPVHRSPRVWSDRIKMVDVLLFRSYIFVRCSLPILYTLPLVYGVSRILMHNGEPAFLRPKDVEAINQFLKLAEEREIIVGDDVEVLSGPMRRVSGKVMLIRKKTVFLFLEQMGVVMQIPISHIGHTDRPL